MLHIKQNPVFMRELRARQGKYNTWLSETVPVLLALPFALLAYALFHGFNSTYDYPFGLAYFQILLLCLLAPALCADMFSKEREQRTWEFGCWVTTDGNTPRCMFHKRFQSNCTRLTLAISASPIAFGCHRQDAHAIPIEVLAPVLTVWIEQWSELACLRIKRAETSELTASSVVEHAL